MISNYSTINVETNKQKKCQCYKIHSIYLGIYTTLYRTYQLLHFKEHIKMTNN